jgi:type VI protein secretion system component VasF
MALWEAGRQQEAEAFRSRVGVFRAVAYVVFAAVVVLVLVFLGYFMRLKGGGR